MGALIERRTSRMEVFRCIYNLEHSDVYNLEHSDVFTISGIQMYLYSISRIRSIHGVPNMGNGAHGCSPRRRRCTNIACLESGRKLYNLHGASHYASDTSLQQLEIMSRCISHQMHQRLGQAGKSMPKLQQSLRRPYGRPRCSPRATMHACTMCCCM